jgi:hypothetical protein
MATQAVKIVVSQTGAVSVKKDIQDIGTAANTAKTPVQELTNAVNSNKSAASNFNVGNIAAQFQDIAVTAAASQSPLQIALQQGTQLSAAFGQGGLGGILKQLGAAFASVLSPVSLLTIGFVGLAAVGIQQVNWMKLFQAAALYVISLLREFISILPTIAPLLAGIGAALLIAFGPAALSAVYALTAAIYTGLIGALATLFTLILSNPLVVLAAGIASAIVYFNGLQHTIEQVITWVGQLIESLGAALQLLGLFSDTAAKLQSTGLKIQIDAKQAAADITGAVNGMTSKIDQALAKAKDYIQDGGAKAAPLLTNGMVAGGKQASDILKAGTAQAAQATYQALNGVPQQIQGAIKAGADYTYNQVTGGYEKSAGSVQAAMQTGGNSAATSVKQALTTGGQSAAQSLTIAGQTVSGDIANVLQTKALEIARLITLAFQTQIAQMQASAAKDRADARATLAGINSHGGGSGSSGSGATGSGSFTSTSGGVGSGAIGVGGVQGGRGPVFTEGGGNGGGTQSNSLSGLTIVNQNDPHNTIAAIDTVQGNKSVINVIKNNPDQIRSILGVV